MMSDFDRIRQTVDGASVFVDPSLLMRTLRGEAPHRLHWAFYYLSGSPTATSYQSGGARADFAVMLHRADGGGEEGGAATLAPGNALAFLYPASQVGALREARYAALAGGEPTARGDFDVYLNGKTLSYIKEHCEAADVERRPFFLTIFPARADDLSPKREFDDFVFGFGEGGKTFGGKCMINAPLPTYPIASVRTGQLAIGEGKVWEAEFFAPSYIDALYRSALASEPAARSVFDVYLDGKTLTYLKDPCAESDARARFLLSVRPADADDLPPHRREIGHDSLNFDFERYGTMFGGKCLAVRRLPDYGVAKIETGQWIPGGERLWTAEIAVGE